MLGEVLERCLVLRVLKTFICCYRTPGPQKVSEGGSGGAWKGPRRRTLQNAFNWGQKGTTKKLCDKDFAERSGELSGAIRPITLVLLGNDW